MSDYVKAPFVMNLVKILKEKKDELDKANGRMAEMSLTQNVDRQRADERMSLANANAETCPIHPIEQKVLYCALLLFFILILLLFLILIFIQTRCAVAVACPKSIF